jgi:hypothetical protein
MDGIPVADLGQCSFQDHERCMRDVRPPNRRLIPATGLLPLCGLKKTVSRRGQVSGGVQRSAQPGMTLSRFMLRVLTLAPAECGARTRRHLTRQNTELR